MEIRAGQSPDRGGVAHPVAGASDGLTAGEAARRLVRFGPNELPAARRRPLVLRLIDRLREPMNLLLLAAAMVSGVLLGEMIDAVAIGAIVAVNTAIGLIQEGRANRALATLEQLSVPEATVVRDGVTRRIPTRELVPGDVVRISAGDRIPADGRLLVADALEVDESLLTGEAVPVQKSPSAHDRTTPREPEALDRVSWGTHATRGSGVAEVTGTGTDTMLGRIATSLDVAPRPTPLQIELARLSTRLGTAAVVIAAVVFAITLVRVGVSTEGLERSFLSAVALAVAAVPEGLPTVTLVALAAGVRRMALHQAIVRRLTAVETLGSATVIVTDKTGTITQNRMTVTSVWALGTGTVTPTELDPGLATVARRIAALVNDATLDPPTGDPMELALLRFAGTDVTADVYRQWPRLSTFPVDSERMRMSTVHEVDAGVAVFVKGAPETLLRRCVAGIEPDGTARSLTDDERADVLDSSRELASHGMRVLGLAQRTDRTMPRDADEAERDLTFVALIGLEDPVRPDAATTLAAAGAAGMRVLMATGDHPDTAMAIAADVGLDTSVPPVTGGQIAEFGLPDDPLATFVYARIEPQQKLDLVKALQERGEVVAMTGDGVNDAPALRRADIGVALGERGSDVAREAADMVVTNDDLATIVTATREGRGIYDNIRKVVDYLVAGNLSEIVVVVGALLFLPGLGVPLLPLQLLWVNLLTDGLPALALGVDRNDDGLMARQPRPRSDHLLGRRRLGHLTVRGGIMGGACLGTLAVSISLQGLEPDRARTMLLTTLVVLHLLYAFVARQPASASLRDRFAPAGWLGTPWLVVAVVAGVTLHLLVVVWEPAQLVFHTTALGAYDWLLIAAGAGVGLLAVAVHRRLGGGTGVVRGRS
ncbi:MAG: cation-transporting P-type ATPase [Nitriliruptoraceae bacterium]